MRVCRTSPRHVLLVSACLPLAGLNAQSTTSSPPDSGEIVVTATRQAQTISKVPISISAFSQETMDTKGIKSFADVARFTPGVRFDPSSNGISIRGISSEAGAGTTGIYIDDTPIQMRGLGFSSDNSLPAVFDLERVEVLRGPQGTLFGAGSEGGTVRYITPQPGLKTFSTYDRAEIATTAHGGLSAEIGSAIGGPIIPDVLGFRVSAWHRRDGGYIDHVDNQSGQVDARNINHGDVTVLRAALAFQPIDGLLITPSVQYQRRTTNAWDQYYPAISDAGDGVFRTSSPEYRGTRDRFVLPTLNVHYDFGGASLIANSSYFKRTNYTGYDGTIYDLSYYQGLYLDNCGGDATDREACPAYPFLTPTGVNKDLPAYYSPSKVTNVQKVFTQEVRLQSSNPNARFNWVVGVFYQHSKQRSTEELIDPQGNDLFQATFGESLEDFFGYPLYGQDSYINNTNGKDEQLAGFADATYAITSKLKLTAGARYAKTKFAFVNFADGSQNGLRTGGSGKSSEKPFTPKVGVNYQADQNNLFYATWAKGFRVGGANPPVPFSVCSDDLTALGLNGAPESYKSDTVKSIELGSKNKLFDHKLQIAASVYQVRWNDIQQTVFLPTCAITFTGNLGKARSRGFDVQMTLTPFHGLTIDGALGYTSTRYTSSVTFGSDAIVVAKGDAIEGPPWTLSLGAQYEFPVAGHGMFLRADYEYQSRLKRAIPSRDPVTSSYDPALIAPSARTLVSLRGGTDIGAANLSLFVDNLFDSAPRVDFGHQDSDTLLFEQTTVRPRTVGLTLTYRQ
jgi:outer membrane receptor protein involved in Fe transport